MKCPRCQQENPPQAKFCLECATSLALRCANCGTQLPGGAKFCFECATPVNAPIAARRSLSPEAYTPRHLAERIITSKAALEGERKQVTVLFADLKGSMELLADRDPEEARKILATRALSTRSWVMASWHCSVRHSLTRTTPCGPVTRRCGCRNR